MADSKKKTGENKSPKVEKSNEPKVVVAGIETTKDSGSIVWAMFLLFAGVIFLLNTTGLLSWNIWSVLWRYWPIFLVLGGIRLILGNSKIAKIIIGIIAIFAFSFIGLVAYSTYSIDNVNFLPRSVVNLLQDYNKRITFRDSGEYLENELEIKGEKYSELKGRSIEVTIGASKFELSDTTDDSYFYASSKYFENFGVPVLEDSVKNDSLDISFKPSSRNTYVLGLDNNPEYMIEIGAKDLATSFDIELGAGEGIINLENLNVVNMRSLVGAGKMTIDLAKDAIPSGDLNIEIGAGEMVLNIPKEIGFNLTYDLGVGDIEYNNEKIASFIGSESDYKSDNYDNAEIKLNIVANVGVGSLKINSK